MKIKLRDYQETAYNLTKEHFKKNDSGKIIHACGTGKTITSMFIAKDYNRVVVFMPNLSLIRQTYDSWKEHLKDDTYYFDPFGDTDGGILGDFISNYYDLKGFIECREMGEINNDKVAEELKLLALNNAFKAMLENLYESYIGSFNRICVEFGFKFDDETRMDFYDWNETFTDGKVYLEFLEGRYHAMLVRDKRKEYTICLDEILNL